MKPAPARGPANMASGLGITLAEGSSKLFGRSIFKNFLLDGMMMTALVVTTAEYGIGAAILLLVAYRLQISGLLHRARPRPERLRCTTRSLKVIIGVMMSVLVIQTAEYGIAAAAILLLVVYRLQKSGPFHRARPRPERLRFTMRSLAAIVVCGGCNVLGRGMITLAITSPGTALATVNAITFAVSTVLYSAEVWRMGQRIAAMLVPLLMTLGLAVSIEAWHTTASLWGVVWSIGSAMSGILYMVLSRGYIDRGGAEADQFQALGTGVGVVGLAVWAMMAGENPSVGWSPEIFLALACTALMTVVIPRYLHTRARRALSDGVYTIVWSVFPLIGLLVDLIMEQKIPTIWQIVGMSLISAVAAGAAMLALPPESSGVQRSGFRRALNRIRSPFGRRAASG